MRIRHNGSLKLRSTGEKFELMKYCTQGFLTQLYHNTQFQYILPFIQIQVCKKLKKKYVTYFSENQTMQLCLDSQVHVHLARYSCDTFMACFMLQQPGPEIYLYAIIDRSTFE